MSLRFLKARRPSAVGRWPIGILAAVGLAATAAAVDARHSARAAADRPAQAAASGGARSADVLRVCSDPNNLPYSNAKGEGFENRIAEIVAKDLGKRVEYTWWAQRRGFIRSTLNANSCDVIIGIPSSVEMLLTTRPYYRSTYVFVQRRGDRPVTSFDDPRLRTLRVGVQLVGDDGANSPPVHALTNRGISGNLVGYLVYGNYAEPAPGTRVVEAVAKRDVDLSIVWGPVAGWAARRSTVPLVLTPVSPQIDVPFLPFVFDMSMGVRRVDVALRDSLEMSVRRRRAEIDAVLAEFGVPVVGKGAVRRPSAVGSTNSAVRRPSAVGSTNSAVRRPSAAGRSDVMPHAEPASGGAE